MSGWGKTHYNQEAGPKLAAMPSGLDFISGLDRVMCKISWA